MYYLNIIIAALPQVTFYGVWHKYYHTAELCSIFNKKPIDKLGTTLHIVHLPYIILCNQILDSLFKLSLSLSNSD